jgi:hypothetical protein
LTDMTELRKQRAALVKMIVESIETHELLQGSRDIDFERGIVNINLKLKIKGDNQNDK